MGIVCGIFGNHFFVIIFEYVLKYVTHKTIMKEKEQENNPTPHE